MLSKCLPMRYIPAPAHCALYTTKCKVIYYSTCRKGIHLLPAHCTPNGDTQNGSILQCPQGTKLPLVESHCIREISTEVQALTAKRGQSLCQAGRSLGGCTASQVWGAGDTDSASCVLSLLPVPSPCGLYAWMLGAWLA
jgi:hypothetical protein